MAIWQFPVRQGRDQASYLPCSSKNYRALCYDLGQTTVKHWPSDLDKVLQGCQGATNEASLHYIELFCFSVNQKQQNDIRFQDFFKYLLGRDTVLAEP